MNAKQLAKWKARGGAAPKVIGIHGPLPVDRTPMDPPTLRFKAKAKKRGKCGGCAFVSQGAAVCNSAGHQAALRGMPSCEDGYVYVLVEADPRQLTIE